MARGSSPESPGRRVHMIFLVYCVALCFIMYLCCLLPLLIYYPTVMARYSLFVLKVPLNPKQTNKQESNICCLCSNYGNERELPAVPVEMSTSRECRRSSHKQHTFQQADAACCCVTVCSRPAHLCIRHWNGMSATWCRVSCISCQWCFCLSVV